VHPFAWAVLAVIVIAIVGFFVLVALKGYPGPGGMPYYGYPGYGWWFFFPFGIFFLFIALFFVGRLFFWPMGWGRRRYMYGDANEILRRRYARGEITKEQFEQMKRDLEQH